MDSSLSPSVSSSTMNNGLCKPMKLRLDLNVVANANNGVANGGVKHPEQVKRRNARERKRVQNVNQGFVTLRNHIPQPNAKSKKLSKVETLRAAATYIQQLRQMLTTDHHNHNRHVTSNNGYSVGVASHLHNSSVHRNPASYSGNHHYDDQVQHDGGGGYGATSIITPSTANYYGGGGYCPQAFSAAAIADSGDYSRSYKTSPSSGGVSAACGGGGGGSPPNGFHATAGYDYVLSPPEIKQYHHMGAEFNVMQSYS